MRKQKIFWFSPLPDLPTDIAHYTMRIAPALAEEFELHLVTDQEKWDPEVLPDVPVIKMSELRPEAGAVHIYNIGNNADFHGNYWEASRIQPGVVVLHDISLQHLFAGYFLHHENRPHAYRRLVIDTHGEQALAAVDAFLAGELSTEDLAEFFPMTQAAVDKALGIVVHNGTALESIEDECWQPSDYFPLPFKALPESAIREALDIKKWEDPETFRIIICGYIGPNRRLDSVFQALKNHEYKSRFKIDIFGKLWDTQLVEQWVRDAQLESQVKVHGFVEESELQAAFTRSHLCINLRYPSMGEASGTQLRLWDHALPSFVTNTGWYRNLSKELVWKVGVDTEVADLKLGLKQFVENPMRFRDMGLKGREQLLTQHSPEGFAKGLAGFVAQVVSAKTELSLGRSANSYGKTIGQIMPDAKIGRRKLPYMRTLKELIGS